MLSHLLIDLKNAFYHGKSPFWRLRKAFFWSRFADAESSVVSSLFVWHINRNFPINDLEMTLTLKICSEVCSSHRTIQKSPWVHLSMTYGLRATKKKPENALRASWNDLDLETMFTKRCVSLSFFKLSLVLLLYHQRFGSY